MRRLNCWEHKGCGREPGGPREHLLGPCPAAGEVRLHGVHGGHNGGRSCWVVAGTLCGGQVQGTFARKYDDCHACDFYRMVRTEEGVGFELSPVLLAKVRGLGNRSCATPAFAGGLGRENWWRAPAKT